MGDGVAVGVIHRSQLVRDGIGDLLARQPGLQIVGRFESVQDVLDHPPKGDHILLYDRGTNKRDGPALMATLRQTPGTKILIFGVADSDKAIIDRVRAGASGCILKDASLDDLLAAISSLANRNHARLAEGDHHAVRLCRPASGGR